MGTFGRALGIARSLLVYHGIPFRQRRLRRLYAQFVLPEDLAFDIGAHAGNRTRALAALGCRVIAVEPQADLARILRRFFAGSTNVTVVEALMSSQEGRQRLWVSDRHPTVATAASEWRDARAAEPGFAAVAWDTVIEVESTTLDATIARYGEPSFIKIDVEGFEPTVLAGLTRPVRTVSFEYLPGALGQVEECIAALSRLGTYEFNWSPGETFALASPGWMTAANLVVALRTPEAQRRSGDVYARLIRR
jgi:FkbM family methyltransferase